MTFQNVNVIITEKGYFHFHFVPVFVYSLHDLISWAVGYTTPKKYLTLSPVILQLLEHLIVLTGNFVRFSWQVIYPSGWT